MNMVSQVDSLDEIMKEVSRLVIISRVDEYKGQLDQIGKTAVNDIEFILGSTVEQMIGSIRYREEVIEESEEEKLL